MTDDDREMDPQRWGDPAHAAPLAPGARELVSLVFGELDPHPAAPLTAPPPSALPPAALAALSAVCEVLTDDDTRRLRTRGKSTPDLLKARTGDLADAPDAVVRPGSHDQVAAVLAVAVEHRLAVVPFGGGTSVTGGLVARRAGLAGVISLDLVGMRRLLAVDHTSMTATLEPGLRGPEAEALLAAEGLTLGHFPQSFEHATIGGFAATRSSGQASAGYGRFDALVVGLRAATPRGPLDLGVAPATAAGPDLRQLLLGSEGAFGVITAVTVRVRALPEVRSYAGWRWPSFAAGADAMRTLAQSGLLPTVIRLSDEAESAVNLAQPDAVGLDPGAPQPAPQTAPQPAPQPAPPAEGVCLMIVGHEGTAAAVAARAVAVATVLTGLGGVDAGSGPGESWAAGRYSAPYLRDSLLDVGILVETLETATFWSRLTEVYDAVRASLAASLGDPSLVLCHLSHVYETGASLYFTVAAPYGTDPLTRWATAKAAATEAIQAAGGTITHHHAVGTDHRPWLAGEIGPVGVGILRAVKAELDPTGILNPGVLVE